ncbi:hypothetical protein BN12_40026 [Nostocoides japonicum T1-X7]|uniref:Uncharacterized protein n=1 Tax=Nostocoides japonicum T1-X7 TaxID=1194083 RepID=A0A077LZM4_9MICO|nr:hypothetical protein [Tetrasphaera japonica]CCH79056.1 hypothetical protein BN12_40026 [Tetrasphaera japonica T1-X7]
MTQPAIQPPPDWKPAGRETESARIVRLFKEEVWNANELIKAYAGRSPKPAHVRPAAAKHVRTFMGSLGKLQRMHRVNAGLVLLFQAFAVEWQDGTGSWTECKPLIGALNDAIMDLEP